MLPLIFAGASLALSAGSQVMAFKGQEQQAKSQNGFQAGVLSVQGSYRDDVLRYQNRVYAEDIRFASESLGYQTEEFSRQMEWTGKAQEAVTRNRDAEAFTLMVRGIEETIATTFQAQGVSRQGQALRGRIRAQERGVEGNSVDGLLNDVSRQEGEAQTVLEMNRDVVGRQLFREALAGDARADNEMSQIASSVRTYAPNAPIRAPSPVNPLSPQAPVAMPSSGALVGNLAGSLTNAFSTYSTLSGQTGKQTFDQLSGWVSRQFDFGSGAERNMALAGNSPF